VALAACAAFASRPNAAAPEPIRILVFNIHAGKDAAGKPNLDGVADLVKSTGAAAALLQEVDVKTARAGGIDQVAALQKATGFDAAFGPSLIHYDGGQYGIATLSRYGIGFQSTVPLTVLPPETRAGGSQEPRVALVAFIQRLQTTQVWHVINTHLDPAEGPARAQEIAHLVEAYRDQAASQEAVLLGGDFNSTPDNPVLAPLAAAGLRDAWKECGSGDGFTYPSDTPAKRIDYLFLSGSLHCAKAEVVDTQISDHRPLLVTLK
jgi:endonuclease/exonuclease/phosphatase family metal-dependent hydrolase